MHLKGQARKRKEKLMKKKLVAILLTLSMIGCTLCGCTSSEQTDQLSMEDIDKPKSNRLLPDNNETFQSELLKKVESKIQTKFGEIDKLTDAEKEELYNSIRHP